MKIIRQTAVAGTLLAIAGAASAATITYDATPDANGVPMSSVAGATTVDFNSGCGYASCSGNYAIVSGSASGLYAAPFVPASGSADSTPYLTVPQNLSQSPVSATFSLGTTADYFGLYWGSIDDYNSIAFLLNGTEVASFLGTDIMPPADGNQTAANTNMYVNFFSLPTFDSITLTSTQYAFESDNHAFALLGGSQDVPEPGSLALFGIGAAGLLWGLRKRRVNGGTPLMG
ncbi:PEP-CTERM sorting domain-containing protein [Salinisphaera sp. T31B1]|uniref:PEP-CTERM sorting domain-containing protein n=1 Tax=Salinisphaera sp. T31B1 TaxID=727963 RepID=UPI00333E8D0C